MIRPVTFDGMLDRNVPIPTFRCVVTPLRRSNRRSPKLPSERRLSSREDE